MPSPGKAKACMADKGPASEAHADVARVFLEKANDDLTVIKKFANDQDISDDVVGFHSQQAIEKSIKAVLTWNGVVFRRTHDLLELVDICDEHGINFELDSDQLALLNPFAVEFRYGFPMDEEMLNRDAVRQLAEAAFTWAKKLTAV